MSNEQWVPALDLYASAHEMREAQKRGGRFADRPDLSMIKQHYVFCDALRNYVYLLGTDPQEPKNKHTKEQPAPDRMTYLIDCARQVLDGKTLQHKWDGGVWVIEESIQDALTSITVAMRDKSLQVRIKPEPVVLPPLYFMLRSNNTVSAVYTTRSLGDTHKLTITNDDGKLSATIEELRKC